VALRRQKSLVLILAREFASQLATPMFIVDGEGNLVFFNEPAERILGQTFAEAGELTAEEVANTFRIETLEGELLAPKERAIGIALREGRATHAKRQVVGADGVRRPVAVTAIPLMTGPDEVDGVVAIFWEHEEG
jgi:PAS domain S-box-containing protein